MALLGFKNLLEFSRALQEGVEFEDGTKLYVKDIGRDMRITMSPLGMGSLVRIDAMLVKPFPKDGKKQEAKDMGWLNRVRALPEGGED